MDNFKNDNIPGGYEQVGCLPHGGGLNAEPYIKDARANGQLVVKTDEGFEFYAKAKK